MELSRSRPQDIEILEETRAVLADRELLDQIQESEQAIAMGDRGSTLTELQVHLARCRGAEM